MEDQKIYISFSNERGFILINQGSPLCDYKKTLAEAQDVANFYRVKLPEVAYNADRAEWVTTSTIEEA
jgi:pullulanase/glycogen debranching enzyme